MIRLVFDSDLQEYDLAQAEDGSLDSTGDLETAALLSLLCDGLVTSENAVDGRRAGWWGDAYASETRDRFGSKLWRLIVIGKTSSTIEHDVEVAVKSALQWMLDDGAIETLSVGVERTESDRIEIVARFDRGELSLTV